MSEDKFITDSHGPGDAPAPNGDGTLAWAKAHHLLLAVLGIGLVIWLLSGFYTVNAGEVAVVERLGSFLGNGNGSAELVESGLHYHLPYPIDIVHNVPVQQQQLLNITDFDSSPAANIEDKKDFLRKGYPQAVVDAFYDPYLITGDQNLVHAAITLRYHVRDPEAYLTCVMEAANEGSSRDNMISQLANHALIQEVAHRPVDFIISGGLIEMQQNILNAAQGEADHIGLGIKIDQVLMAPPKPPAAVAGAFNDVLLAQQEKDTKILNGTALKNSAITKADAEAQSTLFAAQSEKQQKILSAQGEADQFSSLDTKYKVAPDVTKANLFYDTLNSVLTGVNRIIQVRPGEDTTIIIDPPEARKPEQLQPGQSP